jgi:Protein of unknown function (DUF3105)
MRTWALLACALAGCDDALPLPARDLAVAPRDLGRADGAAADAAPDLPVILDGALTDTALPSDLAGADLGACASGYLNSDAGDACPLGCAPAVESVPDEGALHVAFGTPITYQHNPPASGPHWPFPAPWGVHPEVVPQEWWVHNLEHQGIVLLYNCPRTGDAAVADPDGGAPPPDACPNEIAQLAQIYAQHPADNFYDALFEVRILVTGDPTLPKRFAAVAWDWVWMSNNFDAKAIQCFIDSRYGRGPEEAP